MSNTCYRSERTMILLRRRASLAAIVGLLVGGYTTALPVHAEEPGQFVGDVSTEDATTFYTFPGVPRIAISRHGNIVRFEGPTGYEHIGVGSFSEGYVLCYGASSAYDTGDSESGFGIASSSCSGSKCTITRSTTDGNVRLRQVITKNAPLERSLNVEMTITNTFGGGLAGVILRRQADFDVDTGGSKGTGVFANWFGAGEVDSAFAWNPTNAQPTAGGIGEGHAMLLRAYNKVPTTVTRLSKVTENILDTSCSPTNFAADGPVFGDHGATIQFNVGALGTGRTAVLTVQYQRN